MIQRKAITDYYFLNEKNKNNTASFLATQCIATGSKDSPENLEERWRSRIKYYLRNLDDMKNFLIIFDRVFKVVSYLEKVILDCNPTAYAKEKKNSLFAHFKSN
jgi:hypothetical protein